MNKIVTAIKVAKNFSPAVKKNSTNDRRGFLVKAGTAVAVVVAAIM